ncbi:MAG: D-alanyl-D-alanine carboxypeptidase family protein [Alphaproteobacteria bacterium]
MLVAALSINSANAQDTYQSQASQAIMIDMLSGAVLYDKNPDQQVAPASMTKMMTAYIIFDQLKRGILSMEDKFTVSEKAWRKGGSKMFVEVGKQVTVQDLIQGIIVQSGNDATIVAAEAIAGSEAAFGELMSAKARELGMNNTQFLNPSGWPEEGHYSTVRDLATLAIALINNFPEYYDTYQQTEFTYNNIRQFNRNPILGKIAGVDGLKTGHVEAAGYGLTASATRNGRRLVMVIHGMESVKARAEEAARLMEWGYSHWGHYKFFSKGTRLTEVPVWLGSQNQVQAILDQDVAISLPRDQFSKIEFHINGTQPLETPIKAGDNIAQLQLKVADRLMQSYPLIAANNVEAIGGINKIMAGLRYIFLGE